jgi:DNA-binding winged helix-turn-helix (wHTH) protein
MPIYTFGPFLLDMESRGLLREGESIPIAGKTLDTLLALVQNRGRLLDKDELLSLVWPNSVVEEGNLSQSIFAIRKILGDTPKDRRYIATVTGRGYQFVAPVTESMAAIRHSPEKANCGRRKQRPIPILLFGAAISLVLTLIGVAFWRAQSGQHNLASQPQPRRFTSLPGVETMPAFSPDGRQLAYVHSARDPFALHPLGRQMAQSNIYVKLIGAGTELRLTNHPGADYHPAWSPDGEYIAFYRDAPGASGTTQFRLWADWRDESRMSRRKAQVSRGSLEDVTCSSHSCLTDRTHRRFSTFPWKRGSGVNLHFHPLEPGATPGLLPRLTERPWHSHV